MSTRQHSHSHGGHHHHHHDNVYLTSKNKNDAGVRITRIGLYSNLGMAIAKGIGGYVFHSHAMIADAWHSVTDLASDILTLATVSWSIKAPTKAFPTGYGKVESLGSLGVSGMLLFGGLFMGWSAVLGVLTQLGFDPTVLEHLAHDHGHSHSHGAAPSVHAMWLAAGTILIKEWLYHATMKVAKERKSSVLASNAVHHRVDSWTGIVTLVVIGLANFVHNASWLDPVGGLMISVLVVKAGAENLISAVQELVDRGIDEDVKKSVSRQVRKKLEIMGSENHVELRDVSGIKSGQNYLLDLELGVPGGWNVEQLREVEQSVREHVGNKIRGAKRVRARFVPKEKAPAADFDEFISADISPRSSPEPEEEEHNHDRGHSHGNGTKKHR